LGPPSSRWRRRPRNRVAVRPTYGERASRPLDGAHRARPPSSTRSLRRPPVTRTGAAGLGAKLAGN
jgi:hypothetical protein